MDFFLSEVWGEVTNVTACLFKGLRSGCCVSKQRSEWIGTFSPGVNLTWCVLLAYQAVDLWGKGGGGGALQPLLSNKTSYRSLSECFLNFPHLNEWHWKSRWLSAVVPAAVTAISLNRNAKAGKLSYYCDFSAATTWHMLFVFAHSFISPQSSKVCFTCRVRLGNVSTPVLDIG